MFIQKCLFVLLPCVVIVFGQTWVQRAQVKGRTQYFTEVMQETVYELERRGWCNLKLTDITQNLNAQMYKWLVNGTVLYTNGFVVSIQHIDITNMGQQVTSPTIDGVQVTRSSTSGRLNMRAVKLGYDVIANLTDIGVRRYTGDITLNYVTFDFTIVKNWNTNEITLSSSCGTAGGIIRMDYRPADNVTTVLSRNMRPLNTSPGVNTWKPVIDSIVLDIVKNKIEFPPICFVNC